ncbi:MAG TPA: thymidine kinase [Clostridiales bacterium]|nr:thymidine kinase [Clostridiales bacterium]
MAKLYFKYGAMGSSKTAQALITKFNYEERNMKVLFLKPSIDSRDGEFIVKSRVGLSAIATVVTPDENIYELFEKNKNNYDVIIVDECQFLTEKQVDELLGIVVYFDVPVLCFGLRTDFATHMFPGSKRLFEVADSISEIKSICKCGAKATVNARIDENGKIIYEGEQICLGGNDRYIAMCIKCWLKQKKEQEK